MSLGKTWRGPVVGNDLFARMIFVKLKQRGGVSTAAANHHSVRNVALSEVTLFIC